MVVTSVSVLMSVLVLVAGGVSVLQWPPLTCGQEQGLMCEVTFGDCLDGTVLKGSRYTPSAPEKLQVSLGWRTEGGRRGEEEGMTPVVNASWRIRDDGSIQSLLATELQLLVLSTNQNICVRYNFLQKLPMRDNLKQQWFFSASMLAVTPGQTYKISVFNIPKPEQDHSSYNVGLELRVPGCNEDTMKKAQYCIEQGSLWKPNITMGQRSSSSSSSSSSAAAAAAAAALTVSFSPDQLCENYMVFATGCDLQQFRRVAKIQQATLDVAFSLDHWPRTCCRFTVEVLPLFPRCQNDCPRATRTLDLCGDPVDPIPKASVNWTVFVVVGALLLILVLGALLVFYICRTKELKKHCGLPPPPEDKTHTGPGIIPQHHPGPPKVLVIYSQDHRLYRDVVLKLVTFLQSRCGTQVLVDLLDSALLSQVGRIRWLELQRRQLVGPSDKILVLCSRGLQAKWKALCSQGGLSVTLREDLLSPTDDLCIPFLNLFIPDLHRPGMLGKYLVGYFEDFGSEQDIPSLFDVAVKYRLMTQLEDLYLRIVDMEKFQPGQWLRVEGLSGDEYFQCPLGQALRDAIWTFQDYQLENPDWFEKECVDDGEELLKGAWRSSADLETVLPVLQCVPLIRTGPPTLVQEVEVKEHGSSGDVLVLSAERNLQDIRTQCPSLLDEPSDDHFSPISENVCEVEPVLRKPRVKDWFPSAGHTEGVKVEGEQQFLLLSDLANQSISDQGYGSRMSSPCEAPLREDHLEDQHLEDQHLDECKPLKNYPFVGQALEDIPLKEDRLENYPLENCFLEDCPLEDPLEALRKLQEDLLRTNLRYFDTEGC